MISLRGIEFFADTDGSVYVQTTDKGCRILRESDREIITELLLYLSEIHPEAYDASLEIYSKNSRNRIYYEFRAIQKFIRCNWSNLDSSIKDIDEKGIFHFEHVPCAMRGECAFEGIICHPKLNTSLTEQEKEVLSLISEGKQAEKIASELSISIHTVNRHRENIKIKIKVHSVAEMIIWNNKYLKI